MIKSTNLRLFFPFVLIILLFGCDRNITNQKVLQKGNPEEFFLLYDEAITYKIMGDIHDGKIKLDINPLLKKVAKYEGILSTRDFYVFTLKDCWELSVVKRVGNYIIAPAAQEITIVASPVGRLREFYGFICKINQLRISGGLNVGAGLMDQICFEILCPPEIMMGDVIFEEFPELEKFEDILGLGGSEIGGLPPPEPIGGRHGNICDNCFGWSDGDRIIPVDDCYEIGPVLDDSYEIRLVCPERLNIKIINMIPNVLSGEIHQDSEPFLAVQLDTTDNMIGSAFTVNPNGAGQPTAPIYRSIDAGDTWQLINIIASQGSTRDITIAMIDSSFLVAGILRDPAAIGANITQSLQSSASFWLNNTLAVNSLRNDTDQPFTKMYNVNDTGYVFVGTNDTGLPGAQSATLDISRDYGQNYNSFLIENRNPDSQDAPSIRPSMSEDGTVYAGYARYRRRVVNQRFWDITVVRDDNYGRGNNPFQDLVDPNDNIVGCVVDTGRIVIWNNGQALGQHRVGSNLVLAAHPKKSDIVYIGWADTIGTGSHNLHIRVSKDRGQTWSDDLAVFTDAIAPAMAVSNTGVVGILYHQLVGTGANQRWEVKLWQMIPKRGIRRVVTLAKTPANQPVVAWQPYLGDYTGLVAIDGEFRGVFSANNNPDLDNFPQGVTYQRNANFTTKTLTDGTGANVNISIDPFYFKVNIITR